MASARGSADAAPEVASVAKRPRTDDAEGNGEVAEDYFESYDDLSVHLLMLHDRPRVDAYAAAISAMRSSLEGKVVLDVGAGSGVLSLLAAKLGGAKRVYAVEAAAGMAIVAKAMAAKNGLDGVVQVLEGRMEDVELPEKVDAIVSEWMGFYLVHESMLGSVLAARDRHLRPGGLLLPDSARITAALVDAEDFRREVEGLSDIHGLDFSALREAALAKRCSEPQVETLEPGRLLAAPVLVADFPDLRQLDASTLVEIAAEATFTARRSGHAAGIAFWFDVGFGPLSDAKGVVLDTSPDRPPTHWKQTVVYLGAFVPVEEGDVLPVRLLLTQSEGNTRQYNISVETC